MAMKFAISMLGKQEGMPDTDLPVALISLGTILLLCAPADPDIFLHEICPRFFCNGDCTQDSDVGDA